MARQESADTSSVDWASLIEEAIARARGHSSIPIKGAKLRKTLNELAGERGHDLDKLLKLEHLTFSRFLTIYAPTLQIIKQQGSDMLVAKAEDELSSASLSRSTREESLSIRPDLYSALMDFSEDRMWYYDKKKDRAERFNAVPTNSEEIVPLPKTSREEQIRLRESFLEECKVAPLQMLFADKANFLRTFMNHIYSAGLADKWHSFKFSFLKAKLLQWAAQYEIEVRHDWFSHVERKRDACNDIAYMLKQMANYLTEEELRGLNIPLRAVHEFWLAQKRNRPI